MSQNKLQLILASASPRRKELLSYLNINYKIIVSDIDETSTEKDPSKLVENLAYQKMTAVKSKLDNDFCIISADTIVVYQNEVLGKPKCREEAKSMLDKLSGTVHQVYTGVTIATKDRTVSFHECTNVSFNHIDSDLLEAYLDSGDSLDKAGGYGIQGSAVAFVKKVDGCYANVVGLPVNRLINELDRFFKTEQGVESKWRNYFL